MSVPRGGAWAEALDGRQRGKGRGALWTSGAVGRHRPTLVAWHWSSTVLS